MLTVLSVNLLGDWLRDYFDPKLNMTPLLEVRDLTIRFRHAGGTVHAVNDVSYALADGETLGMVGESRLGQERACACDARPDPAPAGPHRSGGVMFEGRDLLALSEGRAARRARRPHRLHLPGPDDLAQPGADDRPPDRRAGGAPSRASMCRMRAGAPRNCSRWSAFPTPARRLEAVSAPVLRRHAPAGDDRDRASPAIPSC